MTHPASLTLQPPLRRASAVLMLPLTHPLTLGSVAHVACAGALVWALLGAAGSSVGTDDALVCATPLALLLMLAASACPHQTPRCHALRLFAAVALLPLVLLGWVATQPLNLAPVVIALGALFLAACHTAACVVLGRLARRAMARLD